MNLIKIMLLSVRARAFYDLPGYHHRVATSEKTGFKAKGMMGDQKGRGEKERERAWKESLINSVTLKRNLAPVSQDESGTCAIPFGECHRKSLNVV